MFNATHSTKREEFSRNQKALPRMATSFKKTYINEAINNFRIILFNFKHDYVRKELNLDHSSLEFLQEPLIPKKQPKNTCFELELLQPCSKKEDPVTLRQKGLETIAILSQDNFAIAYTDGSSDRSIRNGGAGIILLLPDEGLVIFSYSKSAIEAIRNGETNISCDIITLLPAMDTRTCQH
ncbi:hypothetical protein TNCV_1117171 [Trichonephila clavipes]|nr:hypothetical protein TNCV_1117171 [Trichonephila clavipes]